VEITWTIAVRTAAENLSNVRAALPADFIQQGVGCCGNKGFNKYRHQSAFIE
jgi:hypothetical protein